MCPVLFVVALAAVPVLAPLTTAPFPPGTPTRSLVARWERFAGEGESDDLRIKYEMYVEPSRPLLYEITRFRVQPKGGEAEGEVFVWNEHPGQAKWFRCFVRVPEAPSPERGLGWRWLVLEPGSDPYRAAVFMAIRVYALHQKTLEAAAREETAAGR